MQIIGYSNQTKKRKKKLTENIKELLHARKRLATSKSQGNDWEAMTGIYLVMLFFFSVSRQSAFILSEIIQKVMFPQRLEKVSGK